MRYIPKGIPKRITEKGERYQFVSSHNSPRSAERESNGIRKNGMRYRIYNRSNKFNLYKGRKRGYHGKSRR